MGKAKRAHRSDDYRARLAPRRWLANLPSRVTEILHGIGFAQRVVALTVELRQAKVWLIFERRLRFQDSGVEAAEQVFQSGQDLIALFGAN